LWDAKTGEYVATLDGHTKSVYSVAFSPDGEILASGANWDPHPRLWNVKTGKCIAILEVSDDAVISVAFSPGGKLLATGTYARLDLWDVATGKRIARVVGGDSVAFSPDGKTLAAGYGDSENGGRVHLWDVKLEEKAAKQASGASDRTSSNKHNADIPTLAPGEEPEIINGSFQQWEDGAPVGWTVKLSAWKDRGEEPKSFPRKIAGPAMTLQGDASTNEWYSVHQSFPVRPKVCYRLTFEGYVKDLEREDQQNRNCYVGVIIKDAAGETTSTHTRDVSAPEWASDGLVFSPYF